MPLEIAPCLKRCDWGPVDGSYKATLTLPRGAAKAYWATGANMTNLAGKSAVKAFTPV